MNPDFQPLGMLFVEDNAGDVLLFKEALGETGAPVALYEATDGADAIEWLNRNGRPDVIVLDLNLPRKNGRDVMKHLASNDSLRQLPVAVVSTSPAESSICDEFPQLRCKFNVKVADFDQLVQIVSDIIDFARNPEAQSGRK